MIKTVGLVIKFQASAAIISGCSAIINGQSDDPLPFAPKQGSDEVVDLEGFSMEVEEALKG